MSRTIALLIVAFCAFQAEAQFTSRVEVKDGITGYVNVEVIGSLDAPLLLVGPESQPKSTSTGIITVEAPINKLKLRLYSNGKLVPTKADVPTKRGDLYLHRFVITQSGTFFGFVTGIDFEKKISVDEDIPEFTVGPPLPPPPPPPPPQPDVPADRFDNIGQRVALWSSGLQDRVAVGSIYKTVAQRLLEEAITTGEAAGFIKLQRTALVGNDPAWNQVIEKINADSNSRGVRDRLTLSEYWKCIAIGFGVPQESKNPRVK